MDIKTEQAIQAITLYHDLLSKSDERAIFDIAHRALRKAVAKGRAEVIPLKPEVIVTKPIKQKKAA